ncbi:MAG: CBS domain-containing protein [Candidatus Woesearchaeota archaeon]
MNKNHLNRFLIKNIPKINVNAKIKDVIILLEANTPVFERIDYIYVLDDNDNLVGVFSIKDVFNLPKETNIKDIMKTKIVHVKPDEELEKIADIAIKHGLKQIPVVEHNKLLGVVSSRTILATINRALKEDLIHFAGIHKSHLDFQNSLEMSTIDSVKTRIPWILFGLIGTMVIALFLNDFEGVLKKYFIIATFIPAIVYLSDALGNQTQTIFIRDIAVLGKQLKLKTYIIKQLLISSCISLIISFLLFVSISTLFKEPYIAFIIGLANFFTNLFASINGLTLAILIKRFKFDPALGSGPIATIISDFMTIVIYVSIVSLFLR